MSISQAQLVYTLAVAGGAPTATLAKQMAAPLVPQGLLAAIGCRLTGDATTDISNVVRTVDVGLVALTPATATATLNASNRVEAVTVGTIGEGYAAPPLVTTSGGSPIVPAVLQALLKLVATQIVSGGTAYTAPAVYLLGGLQLPQILANGVLSAPGCVQRLGLIEAGSGYSSNARVVFAGSVEADGSLPTASLTITDGVITGLLLTSSGSGLLTVPDVFVNDPGPNSNGEGGGTGAVLAPQMGLGSAASVTPTVTGGAITHLTINSDGGPYVAMPEVLVVDTTGSGAVIIPLMGISSIAINGAGKGYQETPSIVITDLFSSLFGTSAGPATQAPFWNLMKTAIEQAVGSPITAAAPTLS